MKKRYRPCYPCHNSIIRLDTDAHLELPGRIYLSRAKSCFGYDGNVRELLHAYKYGNRLDCERFLVDSLLEKARSMGEFDCIISVPAQDKRMISRGLDACALLARRISQKSNVPYKSKILKRIRSVKPQVGLPRTQRVENVKGVFGIKPGRDKIGGARVLLIDDVLTTGATANDCARALIKAGAQEVQALTVARVL